MKWLSGVLIYFLLIGQTFAQSPSHACGASHGKIGQSLLAAEYPNTGLSTAYDLGAISTMKSRPQPVSGEIWKEHARPSAKWVRDAVIYEVYPRSFSKNESFLSIIKKLPQIEKIGVTVLWIMPIHPIGKLHRKGPLGSPYSIRDYYEINPEYGTLADFKKLVEAVHAAGLHIIMDAVLNHTAWDNPLIKTHPNWYRHNSAGKIVSPNPDWTDVAQLNYNNRNLRRYMIDMLKYWVKDIGVDGFRCDAAELVPLSFWDEARTALDSIKSVMMLAEGAKPDLQLKAFDLTYSWNIYHDLVNIFKGEASGTSIDSLLARESHTYPIGALRMRFNTNHDQNVSDGPAVRVYGPGGDSLTVALIATLPGVPLIYNGEEVGNPKRLSLFRQVTINWNAKNGYRSLYEKIYSIRSSNPELVTGTYKALHSSGGDDVLVYERSLGDKSAVCVFNFSKRPKRNISIAVGENGNPKMVDEVTGKSFKVSRGKLELSLKSYGFMILVHR